ncbi:GIY-YIG nuclease family protein [Hominenteromicrobium sp.]|uniref:GIY-YIG nuclease family protein n=1 Tax=Hominenteromicrobium sp. TaxID=3073581 RepID=UPI003AB7BDE7
MAMRGKSINLFLMDGEPGGRIKCTLANWTGVAYKIPRTALDLCKERDDLKQSGIYFLFGTSDQTGNNVVYIGQAGARKNGEGLLYRLLEHKRNPDKDYWTEAIVFTTSNNSFGPTEISYLENRFCGLAFAAKRYDVKNGNDPTHGNITEEKESELEEFVDYARIVMGTLGHKVFEPLVAASPMHVDKEHPIVEEPLLYFENSNAKATGRRTSEGFVVFKGSTLSQKIAKSCPEIAIKARTKYSGKIEANSTLTEDVLLTSPSSAAAFVGGSSSNGNELWKTKEGVPLKSLEKASE